jgi:FRG domain
VIQIEFRDYSAIKIFCNSLPFVPFYRGTKDSSLLPKLITPKFTSYKDFVNVEEEMNNIFCWQFPNLTTEQNRLQRSWEYRIIAREHGLFNRLMDWTNNLTTAIDFATSKPNEVTEEHIYLWVLNYPDSPISTGELRNYSFLQIAKTMLVHGTIYAVGGHRLAQHRQFVQGGFFLIQPSHLIMEPVNIQPVFKDSLIKIKIPAVKLSTIREEMIQTETAINFSESIMFSENDCIDDFCIKLNTEHLF